MRRPPDDWTLDAVLDAIESDRARTARSADGPSLVDRRRDRVAHRSTPRAPGHLEHGGRRETDGHTPTGQAHRDDRAARRAHPRARQARGRSASRPMTTTPGIPSAGASAARRSPRRDTSASRERVGSPLDRLDDLPLLGVAQRSGSISIRSPRHPAGAAATASPSNLDHRGIEIHRCAPAAAAEQDHCLDHTGPVRPSTDD